MQGLDLEVLYEYANGIFVKITVFWDVTPCSLVAIYRYFKVSFSSITSLVYLNWRTSGALIPEHATLQLRR